MRNTENLKVGDKVVITVGGTKISTVERVTERYITAGGIRFNRKYGWATGTNVGIIRPATEEDMQKYGNSSEE